MNYLYRVLFRIYCWTRQTCVLQYIYAKKKKTLENIHASPQLYFDTEINVNNY